MHHKRRAGRPFAAAGAMATVATCIVTFQLVTGPTGATAVDPPSRPGVATQSGPSFPVLGTPGYVEWQGAISSAREYVSAAQQAVSPGSDVTIDYQYEYHGGWLGVLCPSTTTSCGLVEPHGPAPVPSSQLGGESAFLGANADPQAYGTHSDQDIGVPAGPVLGRLRVSTGGITEEVATTTVRTGPNHADVWYTVVRRGRLTFRLPATLPGGPLFLGLNNHPSSALSIFGGAYLGATSPYRSAAYERTAWWTGGALLDLRNPTAGVPPTSLPPSIPAPPPEQVPPPTTYVALGDSYSSGEGLPKYELGTNTPTDRCHRSSKAYSQLLTPNADPFVACSGQTTDAFWDSRQGEPAQSLALDDTDTLVTMTFGGNNLGWTNTLIHCTKVEYQVIHSVLYYDGDRCKLDLAAMPKKIADMRARLVDVYDFTMRQAPNARVRVLTYPPLFPLVRSKSGGCRIARINAPHPLQLVIAANIEHQFALYETEANSAIMSAVAEVGSRLPGGSSRLQVVDVENQFGGYGPHGHTISCGDTGRPKPWINSVRLSASQGAKLAGDLLARNFTQWPVDAFSVYSASFHPIEEGQRQMSAAVASTL